MTFTAKFPGPCAADCGEQIAAGDEVLYVDDKLVHDGCLPLENGSGVPADITRPICPECFTERAVNGKCACV